MLHGKVACDFNHKLIAAKHLLVQKAHNDIDIIANRPTCA
jgi:hypothetical protein